MSILDDALEYSERKDRIAGLTNGDGANVEKLDALNKRLKQYLLHGGELCEVTVDKETGEVTACLDLPESNTRLLLRPMPAVTHICPTCKTLRICRKPSTALVLQPIENAHEAAKEMRRDG